jgi:hypothetical protein
VACKTIETIGITGTIGITSPTQTRLPRRAVVIFETEWIFGTVEIVGIAFFGRNTTSFHTILYNLTAFHQAIFGMT